MKFILLGLLLFDLIVNAEHYTRIAMACAMPTQCHSQNVSVTPQFNPPIQSVIQLLDSRYLPIDKLEACNIREFCRCRVPGNYCYSPAGNCNCLSSVFVQCPFGIVNVCKRGYGCKNAQDSFGFMNATCERFSTTKSTAFNKTLNLPFTFPSIAPVFITATSCGGTIVGTATTLSLAEKRPMAIFQSELCPFMLPASAAYNPRTTRIIVQCPVTFTSGESVSNSATVILQSSSSASSFSNSTSFHSNLSSSSLSNNPTSQVFSSIGSTSSSPITSILSFSPVHSTISSKTFFSGTSIVTSTSVILISSNITITTSASNSSSLFGSIYSSSNGHSSSFNEQSSSNNSVSSTTSTIFSTSTYAASTVTSTLETVPNSLSKSPSLTSAISLFTSKFNASSSFFGSPSISSSLISETSKSFDISTSYASVSEISSTNTLTNLSNFTSSIATNTISSSESSISFITSESLFSSVSPLETTSSNQNTTSGSTSVASPSTISGNESTFVTENNSTSNNYSSSNLTSFLIKSAFFTTEVKVSTFSFPRAVITHSSYSETKTNEYLETLTLPPVISTFTNSETISFVPSITSYSTSILTIFYERVTSMQPKIVTIFSSPPIQTNSDGSFTTLPAIAESTTLITVSILSTVSTSLVTILHPIETYSSVGGNNPMSSSAFSYSNSTIVPITTI